MRESKPSTMFPAENKSEGKQGNGENESKDSGNNSNHRAEQSYYQAPETEPNGECEKQQKNY